MKRISMQFITITIILVLLMVTLLGCSNDKDSVDDLSILFEGEESTVIEVESAHINIAQPNTESNGMENPEIFPVSDKTTEEWTNSLIRDGQLTFDLNKDNLDDSINMILVEKEGSMYIQKFELSVSGIEESFTIEKEYDYDADFKKLELFDFDQDLSDELVLLFDTHGGGGQGTHDIYIIEITADAFIPHPFEYEIDGLPELDTSYIVDMPYSIEKVMYNGTERLLIRQYVWDENQGHSGQIGDLFSIVMLDKENNRSLSEISWLEQGDF